MPLHQPQIVFLTYIPRSGSTLLARYLHEFPDVWVSLESDFPDGIRYRELRIHPSDDPRKKLDKLYEDPKFCTWSVDKEEIVQRLPSNADRTLTFADWLPPLLQSSADKPVAVYKVSPYIWALPKVKKEFPTAKIIFIQRDPRAIYASQKRSRNSKTGNPMTDNPIRSARQYKKTMRILETYKDAAWFHVVSYEQLVTHPDTELEKVARFLGVSSEREQSMSYAESIPESQRHLHQYVSDSPLPEKVYAWKQELTNTEIYAVERSAGPELHPYEHAASPPTFFERIAYLKLWLHYLYCRTMKDKIKNLFYWVRYGKRFRV